MQALVRGSEVYDDLDVDEAMELYDYTGDEEKEQSRIVCEASVALTRLEQAVKKKFGKEASDAMLHAAGEHTVEDVKEANIKIEGERAVVQYKGDQEPSFVMVRAKGIWKLSARESMAGLDKDARKAMHDTLIIERDEVLRIERQLNAEKYKTAEEVIAAVTRMIDSLPQPAEQKGK